MTFLKRFDGFCSFLKNCTPNQLFNHVHSDHFLFFCYFCLFSLTFLGYVRLNLDKFMTLSFLQCGLRVLGLEITRFIENRIMGQMVNSSQKFACVRPFKKMRELRQATSMHECGYQPQWGKYFQELLFEINFFEKFLFDSTLDYALEQLIGNFIAQKMKSRLDIVIEYDRKSAPTNFIEISTTISLRSRDTIYCDFRAFKTGESSRTVVRANVSKYFRAAKTSREHSCRRVPGV